MLLRASSRVDSSLAVPARLFRGVLSLGLLTALAACTGASPDATEASEQDVTIRPKGNNGLATVTVNAPWFFTPTFVRDGVTYTYSLDFNGTPVVLGEATQVVPTSTPGNWGCLTIVLRGGALNTYEWARECVWQLASGGSLTIDLGVAKVWWSGYPQIRRDVFSIANPGVEHLARTVPGARYRQYEGTYGFAFRTVNDIPLLLVPGDYEVALDDTRYPAKPFKVVAGQQTDMNADQDAFLATAKLTYEAAEFADATSSGSTLRCTNADGQTTTKSMPARWTEQLVMLDADTASCSLAFGGSGALSVPLALARGNSTSVALHRLDVDDVTLTDEGNRQIPGTFNVRRMEGSSWGGWILDKSSPTKRGLDLPAGHYQVRVDYVAATGPTSQDFEADLP